MQSSFVSLTSRVSAQDVLNEVKTISYILFQLFPPLLLVSLAVTDQERGDLGEKENCMLKVSIFSQFQWENKKKKVNPLSQNLEPTWQINTSKRGFSTAAHISPSVGITCACPAGLTAGVRSYLCPTLDKQKHPLFLIFSICWENGGKSKSLSSRCMGFSSTLGTPAQKERAQELGQGTLLCQGSQQTLFIPSLNFSCR